MSRLDNNAIRQIKASYSELTSVEKRIGDFFIENTEMMVFSSREVSSRLYVSEASLSRFAKKCGYRGFREFIYDYERAFSIKATKSNFNDLTRKVLDAYQEILDKSARQVNEMQMYRIAAMLSENKRVYVYGMGSSGIAAKEFQFRFMRLGLYTEAISDSHMMMMNASLADEDVLVMAFSISGTTKEVVEAAKIAKAQGAKVVFVTASTNEGLKEIYDEVLTVATIKNMEVGNVISPQYPLLIMVDIFYTYYLDTDFYQKLAKHTNTLSALRINSKL